MTTDILTVRRRATSVQSGRKAVSQS